MSIPKIVLGIIVLLCAAGTLFYLKSTDAINANNPMAILVIVGIGLIAMTYMIIKTNA